MAKKRRSGTKNYLYFVALGSEVTGDGAAPLPDTGFYKITAIIGTPVGWPSNAVVGDIIYNYPAITPAVGEDAKPMTLTKVAWVTDVPNSASKEKFDDTTQIDDAKSFEEGDKPEISGSWNGYFFSEDADALTVLKRFFVVTEDDGAGTQTINGLTTGVIHTMLGRNETTVAGEEAIMQYLPVILDNLNIDKPLQGKQPFNCNYTAVGSERPTMYIRTIT